MSDELEPAKIKKVVNSATINLDGSITKNLTHWVYQVDPVTGEDVCTGTYGAYEAVPAPATEAAVNKIKAVAGM